jgi:hypothetical protein
LTWRSKHADPAAWLRQLYEPKQLKSFEIKPFQPISAMASRIPVGLKYRPIVKRQRVWANRGNLQAACRDGDL